jgi:gas vesicle protein
MKRFSYWVIGLLVGGMVGAATGLLLAPASGKEMRERISGYSRQAVVEVRSAADLKRQELETELAKLKSGSSHQ